METTLKTCARCGQVLTRKRFDSGRLEDRTAFEKRKFCSLTCANSRKDSAKAKRDTEAERQTDKATTGGQGNQTAMAILEDIANDKSIDVITRANAAKALLPYQAKKARETGKKQEKAEAAKEAGKGRFGAMSGPKVVNIRKD